jgi:tRNA modification GTPase
MSDHIDTIAAIATASGRGGVGIIRVSGPLVQTICKTLVGGPLQPRKAYFRQFHDEDGETLDSGLALYFKAPASYTGEDTLELQGHGGPVVLDMLLKRVLSLGARVANPGEFTQRAFCNNKLDLAQAEAVADIIDAGTQESAKSAQRSLQGAFSEQITLLQNQLTHIRLYVESAIDFSDEDIDFLASSELKQKIEVLLNHFSELQKTAKQGCLLREGMTVVIVGKPNAGKSSLLNALAKKDAAIVTDIEGTTRDILREQIQIDGMPLHIIDTAGLRDTDNVVEKEGVRRAHDAMKKADRILLVVDDRERNDKSRSALLADLPDHIPASIIYNKIDLTDALPGEYTEEGITYISVSTKTTKGLDSLTDYLKKCMGFNSHEQSVFLARRRHIDALVRAVEFTKEGAQQFEEHQAGELFAEDLRQAQNALSEITGKVTPDDLLGEIFSSFCIGK